MGGRPGNHGALVGRVPKMSLLVKILPKSMKEHLSYQSVDFTLSLWAISLLTKLNFQV